ncbi:MAG: aldose 1-epimerase [Lachnospiraceae bacterium]
MAAEKVIYAGYPSLKLSFNNYEVIITYGKGCNIVEFKDISRNISFLHFPENDDEVKEFSTAPQRFGSAVLFPPNKLTQGQINWNKTCYDLEANGIPSAHGLLKEFPYNLDEIVETDDSILIKFSFNSVDSPYNAAFNWLFTVSFEFCLSDEGLTQTITIENTGSTIIPLGVGFHTSFRIPENDDYQPLDYTIYVTSDKQWELSDGFPTGRLISPVYDFTSGNLNPMSQELAEHITAVTIDNFHGAVIYNNKSGTRFVYETDPVFTQWMIWNKKASDNYVCIEPMTCIIDAPNRDIPAELHGFSELAPGKLWQAKNKFYVKY